MTMTEPTRDTGRDTGRDTPLSPEEERAAARLAWHESGGKLTGKELAEMFGRSAKWGQNQRAAAEREAADRGTAPVPPSVPRHNGTAPPSVPPSPTAARGTTSPAARPAATRHTPAPPPAARPAPPRHGKQSAASRRVTILAVLVVAVVAAVASFDHQRELAEMAGEGWRAWLLPLSVDGLILAASMVLLDRRRTGQEGGWLLPWTALVLGAGASLAANVAAAEPTLVGRLVAAWPPVALLLAFELLLRQVGGRR